MTADKCSSDVREAMMWFEEAWLDFKKATGVNCCINSEILESLHFGKNRIMTIVILGSTVVKFAVDENFWCESICKQACVRQHTVTKLICFISKTECVHVIGT